MPTPAIRIKRVYDPPDPSDGLRILIDRLWPRGLSKAKAQIDLWTKDLAPSTQLRQWYQHDPAKWPEFQSRYAAELDANPAALAELLAALGSGPATFLFSSRETRLNNAHALKLYIESR